MLRTVARALGAAVVRPRGHAGVCAACKDLPASCTPPLLAQHTSRRWGSSEEGGAAAEHAAAVAASQAHMALLARRLEAHRGPIVRGLTDHGWAVVDDFLPPPVIEVLRAEAEGLREGGHLEVSKSERYCAAAGGMVAYEKAGVEAVQLQGGEQYWAAPRLTETVAALAPNLAALVNGAEGEGCARAALDGSLAGNKLAVCLGRGAYYDKHYDNAGGEDFRKLTALIYLNPGEWREELGGQFRMFLPLQEAGGGEPPPPLPSSPPGHPPQPGPVIDGVTAPYVDLEPRGGRLLCFWSDRCVHSVLPAHAPRGQPDHRWALTVWLPTARGAEGVHVDRREERYHWPTAQ